jgi:hypothetical protein
MPLAEHVVDPYPAVYRRELPGGGYVLIQVDDSASDHASTRTRVWVERRALSQRRNGHNPVIIAEVDGDERSSAFADLYRMACDNAAIARELLRVEGRAD